MQTNSFPLSFHHRNFFLFFALHKTSDSSYRTSSTSFSANRYFVFNHLFHSYQLIITIISYYYILHNIIRRISRKIFFSNKHSESRIACNERIISSNMALVAYLRFWEIEYRSYKTVYLMKNDLNSE